MDTPRVLVGCPTSDHKAYCLDEYAKAIKQLTYKNHDVLLVDNSETEEYVEWLKQLKIPVIKDTYFERARERIVHSRNILRETVLEKGYNYFLSLEQDVLPPKDVIEQLLSHGKKVVTGVYFTQYTVQSKPLLRPLLWTTVPGKKELVFVAEKNLEKPALLKIKASGLGCMLIHRSVLEKISFRLHEPKVYDDMAFCHDLAQKGIDLYVDTSVKCKHLIKGMEWDKIKE
jgi:GT2 family glycosyltransferase